MPIEALLQFTFRGQAQGPKQTVTVGGSKSPEPPSPGSSSEPHEHENFKSLPFNL